MTGTNIPPRYYWLWHLAALNVIRADFGPVSAPPSDPAASGLRVVAAPAIGGTVWDRIAALGPAEATVALIDTGVSRTHPNLAGRIDTARSIDLTSHRYGAQTEPVLPGTTPMTREERRAFFQGLDIRGLQLQLESDDNDYLEALVEELRTSQGVVRRMIDAEETFAAHGTACAGLLVGEPAALPGPDGGPDQTINPNPNLLPYFGADPFSRLVSIRTSFEPDPVQFITAFLHAWACGVDAIVLPRGLPDPVRSRLSPKEELKADLETWQQRRAADLFQRLSVIDGDAADADLAQQGFRPDRPWAILRNLVIAISRHVPVICAAGNDGESQLIYPANLADETNGIIAVGAVTAEGFRAGYSNYGEGLTLVAPSDDYEVYNRHQMRIDRFDPLIDMHDFSVGAGTAYAYSHLELVTTDLPGVFGYDGGSQPWSMQLPGPEGPAAGGGYYTAFGGTSGASCLVGGLALLAQRARRAAGQPRLDGPAMKEALLAAASTEAVVAPGIRPLTPDRMNADNEDSLGHSHFFGAGLPDADRLITGVLGAMA